MVKTSAAKMKTVPSELGRPSFVGVGFDHELQSNSILWGSPQNPHLLALLRANQNPNPNPSLMSSAVTVKEEGNIMGTQMLTESLLNGRTLGFDPTGQVPSLGLCSSFWKNNNQDQQPQQENGGFLLGEHQNSGIQELYQRLRSSSASYCSDNSSPLFLSNMASNSSSSSSLSILESAPPSGVELGYWNPTLSWSDLSTANGAYP